MQNQNDTQNKNKLLTQNSLSLFHFKAWISLSRENMLHDMRNHQRQRLYVYGCFLIVYIDVIKNRDMMRTPKPLANICRPA